MDPITLYHRTFLPDGPYVARRRYRAFQIAGRTVHPTWIVEKLDQDFANYATDWEKQYSKLASSRGLLDPVVDQNLTVVGYLGDVSERSMVRPECSPDSSRLSLGEYLSRYPEVPVFVSVVEPEGWIDFDGAMPATIASVVTGIDGKVVAGQYATCALPKLDFGISRRALARGSCD